VALTIYLRRYFAFVSSLDMCDGLIWWRFTILIFTSLFLFLAYALARGAVNTWQIGQSPYPDADVFFRTRIQRGPIVRINAVGNVVIAFGIVSGLIYLHAIDPIYALLWSGIPCRSS